MLEINYQYVFLFRPDQIVNQKLYNEDFLALALVKTQFGLLFLNKFGNELL